MKMKYTLSCVLVLWCVIGVSSGLQRRHRHKADAPNTLQILAEDDKQSSVVRKAKTKIPTTTPLSQADLDALKMKAYNLSRTAAVILNGTRGPSHVAKVVANTLNNLGNVIHRMFDQVRTDEKVFQAFKHKLLEDEVAAANLDLSWPAIKDLVKTEVRMGEKKMNDMLAQFKIDVLNVVQVGLDALRSDIRTTVLSGYFSSGASAWNKMHRQSIDVDDINAPPPLQPLWAKNVSVSLDRFLKRMHVKPKDKKDIRRYVMAKFKSNPRLLDAYGETAASALADMEAALRGKLSIRDMRSEIFVHLRDLTQAYLRHPSPAAGQALNAMRQTIIHSLNSLKVNVTAVERDMLSKAHQVHLDEQAKQKRQVTELNDLMKLVSGVGKMAASHGLLKRTQRQLASHSAPAAAAAHNAGGLDALSAAANSAVEAAERAAAQGGSINDVTKRIHEANQHINQLTSRVTNTVRSNGVRGVRTAHEQRRQHHHA